MPHPLPFHVLGISHRTACVADRERFALGTDEIRVLLERTRDAGRTLVVMSTCNRFELYWWGDAAPAIGFPEHLALRLSGEGAARHLFSVASGLESQVLGEAEVLGQLRRAWELARGIGSTQPEMDQLFTAALAAGRRVRRETPLGRKPVSLSLAAAALARAQAGNRFDRAVVVVLGAGEAAQGVMKGLLEAGAGRVEVVNRHVERADALAGAWGAVAAPWETLDDRLFEADVVIAATAAPHAVLTAERVRAAMERRMERPLFVIDLALPRNVEPGVRGVSGVRLVDLDDLHTAAPIDLGLAAEATKPAERLLEEEIARYQAALRGRAAAPQLAELHRLGAVIAEEETARALGQLEDLSEHEREVLREMAERLVRRLLYPTSRHLRTVEVVEQAPMH